MNYSVKTVMNNREKSENCVVLNTNKQVSRKYSTIIIIQKITYLHGNKPNRVHKGRHCSSIGKPMDEDLNNGNHWDSRQKSCKFIINKAWFCAH